MPVQMNWLSWLWRYLDELGDAMRQELARAPDDGDLLIALATAADSMTGRALRHSGVDLDGLRPSSDRFGTSRMKPISWGRRKRYASKKNRR